MRRILKIAVRLILLVFFVALAWGGWYVNRKGFTRHWRQFVNSEFEKRGLSVSIHRLTLDPFHGLIARDVEIMDVKNRRRTLAVISKVVLDINYSNLLHHHLFLNGVDLRDTKLTLLLDPSNPASPRIQIAKLNARVLFPPNRLYVSQADAYVSGIHVFVTGQLIYPEALHPAFGTPNPAGARQKIGGPDWIAGLIERLRTLQFEAGAPQLEIRFAGDGREPEKISADATLWGKKIRNRNYRLENIYCVASYREGLLNLEKCVASDNRGALDLSGKWQPAAGLADFQLRSTLNIQALLHAFQLAQPLDDFLFYDSPRIELSSKWDARAAPAFMLVGRVALKKFAFRSVPFESLVGDFSWDGSRWYARDFQLAHRTGTLTASAIQLPGDFRATLQSTLNPGALLALFPGAVAESLSEWDFIDSPKVQLTIGGRSSDLGQCETTGKIQLGRTVFRGSPMDRAESNVRIKSKAVTYEQFKIERGDGVATGTFTYDFGRHEIRLEKIKNTIYPEVAAPWINRDVVKNTAPYRFKARPNISIDGVVQYAGGKNTRLEILVDAPGGMDYVFLKKNLSFSRISAKLLFTDGSLKLSDVDGSLFSGRVRGGAEISLERNAPGHSADIGVENIDFASLTKLYFNYNGAHGKLNGRYTFTGRGDDARRMQGMGHVDVTNGSIFTIPFLGPLTGILNSIVPGMGYDEARMASADFRVREGAIDTKNFLVTGHGFNMIGGGRLFFLDDKMNFDVRINAQGLPGVVLFPVSKLFEYASDGSLSKPVWRPKRMPGL